MKYTKMATLIYLILSTFIISASAFATTDAYIPFKLAWESSSLVVFGKVISLGTEKYDNIQWNKYKMLLKSIYKGEVKDNDFVFFTPGTCESPGRTYHPSSENIKIEDGKEYLIFLQRDNPYDPVDHSFINGHIAIIVTSTNKAEIENAVRYFMEFDRNRNYPEKIRKYLLEEAKHYNAYTSMTCDSEIIRNNYTEAIPIYLDRLNRHDEYDNTNTMRFLFSLGYDRIKLIPLVEKWLIDYDLRDGVQDWGDASLLLNKLGADFVPVIRKFINSRNEMLAVITRRALLEYGESNARQLLLDMAKNGTSPIARYTALNFLHMKQCKYTAEEIELIKSFASDKDPVISRISKSILLGITR
jgi:hypothetical protein